MRALVGFLPGGSLRGLVSSGAWLESSLWAQIEAFLFQNNRNPGVSLFGGRKWGNNNREQVLVLCGVPGSLSIPFPLIISFSDLNLKQGRLCLVSQQFLK